MSTFDPSDFDYDVYCFSVRGLGRGHGFAKTEEFSIFTSDKGVCLNTRELLKDRIMTLSKLFMDNGVLEGQEVLDSLNIETIFPNVVTKRDEVISDLTEDNLSLRKTLSMKEKAIATLTSTAASQKRQLDTLKKYSTQREIELQRLYEEINSSKGKVRSKDSLIKNLSEETIGLQKVINTLKGKCKKLENDSMTLKEDRDHHITQVKELIKKIHEYQDKIDSLNSQIADLSEATI